MAKTPTPAPKPVRPVMDEWGVYDPQQAGLSALFARLDSRDAAKPKEDVAAKPQDIVPTPPERPTLRDAK